MNRFIYVVGERKDRKPLRTAPLTEEEKKEASEIVTFLKAVAARASITILKMTSKAKKIYDLFEEEIEDRIADEDLGIREGYCGQLPNLAVRIACLYRISRMTIEELQSLSNDVLFVGRRDVERAIGYVEKAWLWFEKAIDMMRQPQVEQGARGSLTRKGIEIVIDLLREGPKKREHILPLTQKSGISDSLVDNQILRSLIEAQMIRRDKSGWYSLVTEQADNTQQNEDEAN